MSAPRFRVQSTSETFWDLYGRLHGGDPFVYARYGDGELLQIMGGRDVQNEHRPKLGEELRELLARIQGRNQVPDLLGLALHTNEPGMEPGLFEGWQGENPHFVDLVNEVAPTRIVYANAIALHYYSIFKPDQLRKLFDLRRKSTKVFVGNADPDKLEPALGTITHYVHVPYTDSYDSIDDWFPCIQSAVDDGAYLVYLACGSASKAASLRMLQAGMQVQSIDLGSVADYLAGNTPNRTWIRLANERFPSSRGVVNGGV